jgi:hypothetical protein
MRLVQGVCVLLAVALVVGTSLQGQEKKDDTPVKLKGVLPANWGKLGLSDEQKQKIYKIQGDFDTKTAGLEKQLKDLKAQEQSEMLKVLTDAQKARLKEILLEKLPTDKK